MKQFSIKRVYDCVGKLNPRKLCKKMKFTLTTKRYKHKPESKQENETHKILLDFEMQTDCLVFDRRPDNVLIDKKGNLLSYRFFDAIAPQSEKNESEKTFKFFCPVDWDCGIHWLHFYRGVRPSPTIVLDITLNNQMVRF